MSGYWRGDTYWEYVGCDESGDNYVPAQRREHREHGDVIVDLRPPRVSYNRPDDDDTLWEFIKSLFRSNKSVKLALKGGLCPCGCGKQMIEN